jgi:hypothetical protein
LFLRAALGRAIPYSLHTGSLELEKLLGACCTLFLNYTLLTDTDAEYLSRQGWLQKALDRKNTGVRVDR